MEFPFKNVCRDYMRGTCCRQQCRFIHDAELCKFHWNHMVHGGTPCKSDVYCKHKHFVSSEPTNARRQKKQKNTECFEPMQRPVDMRLVVDCGDIHSKLQTKLTTRDVLLVPNLFADFARNELHDKLLAELQEIAQSKDSLFKMWHGNEQIEGTHLIADDKLRWKEQCPTFECIIRRIETFFNMDIQATRCNWYKDTSHWKPFHHDAAYLNPEKARVQNFTVAVSFGATRDAAFEHATTKTVISLPQADGIIYCFANDTNGIWRHGILQEQPTRDASRISVICWGKVDIE